MSNWKTYRLSELIHLVGGGTPKTTVPEYWNGEIPWLSVADIGKGIKKVYHTEKSITEKGLNESSTKILKEGQIIISARGTVGELAVLGRDMAFNQSCYGIYANDKTENNFLYYLLKYSIGKIKKNTHGAVFDTITKQTFDNIEVAIPESTATQRQIAQILTSLDDKIELNLQMNQTLEAMAQAIFKEWFVNFNFPGFDGELVDGLPKGWRNEPMDENIDFLNGLALQKFPPLNEDEFLPVIKIRELKQGFTTASDKASTEIPEKYVICNGDILFSWSGSLEIVLWCDGKGALNQHLFKVSSNVYPKWFYFFWVREYLPLYKSIAEGKATTMGHIQRRHLTDTIINVPNKELMNLADSILSPILEKIQENKIQIQSLTKTRDTLLPKLMSGALEVKSEEWKVESEK
jgi:type I restriction enzyme S subunit